MIDKKIVISRKSGLKGDDGYKIFSIRIKKEIVQDLDELAETTNRSRNELISILLEFAVSNCETCSLEVAAEHSKKAETA